MALEASQCSRLAPNRLKLGYIDKILDGWGHASASPKRLLALHGDPACLAAAQPHLYLQRYRSPVAPLCSAVDCYRIVFALLLDCDIWTLNEIPGYT